MGHANHARYFTWFESARIALFAKIGIQADKPRDVGPDPGDGELRLHPSRRVSSVDRVRRPHPQGRAHEHHDGVLPSGSPDEPRSDPARAALLVAVLVDYRTMQKVEVPGEVRASIAALVTDTCSPALDSTAFTGRARGRGSTTSFVVDAAGPG